VYNVFKFKGLYSFW